MLFTYLSLKSCPYSWQPKFGIKTWHFQSWSHQTYFRGPASNCRGRTLNFAGPKIHKPQPLPQGHCKSHGAFCDDGFVWHVGDVNAKLGLDWYDDRGLANWPSGSLQHLSVPLAWHWQLRVFLHCRTVRTHPLPVECPHLPTWHRMAGAVLLCVAILTRKAPLGRT